MAPYHNSLYNMIHFFKEIERPAPIHPHTHTHEQTQNIYRDCLDNRIMCRIFFSLCVFLFFEVSTLSISCFKFAQKIPFKKVRNLSRKDKNYSFSLRRLLWMVPRTWFTWMDHSGLVWNEIYGRHYLNPWLQAERAHHDSKQNWLRAGWRNPNLGSRELQAGRHSFSSDSYRSLEARASKQER